MLSAPSDTQQKRQLLLCSWDSVCRFQVAARFILTIGKFVVPVDISLNHGVLQSLRQGCYAYYT